MFEEVVLQSVSKDIMMGEGQKTQDLQIIVTKAILVVVRNDI